MGLSRRQFTREFQLTAVGQLEQGGWIGAVARALEMNPNVLHRWRREFRQGRRGQLHCHEPEPAEPPHGELRADRGLLSCSEIIACQWLGVYNRGGRRLKSEIPA